MSSPAAETPIRCGTDDDGAALLDLIWSCWSRYPGIRMDVDGEMPEFRALSSYYAGQGGRLWVADGERSVAGMIAVRPIEAGWEICRLYVDPGRHGDGLAHRLLDQAEAFAKRAGAQRLMLWSDTRFDRAHRFYGKRSYVRHGPIRVLQDISGSLEFGYAKPVDGVALLDIAAAASAEAPLSEILQACAAAGDQTGFLPPLTRAAATLRSLASDVGTGRRRLAACWRDGVLRGFGVLDLDMPEDQAHSAVVERLLVHPAARRNGLARAVLNLLEEAAIAERRSLLTLQTRAGEAGAATCRALGWHAVGTIPALLQDADGRRRDATLFWKKLATAPEPTAGSARIGAPLD